MEKIFYLANVFEGLHIFCIVLLVLSSIAFIVSLICYFCNYSDIGPDDEDTIMCRKIYKWAILSLLIGIIGVIFVPDKKTYLLMTGSKVVEETYKNHENLQELPNNTVDFLNEYLKTLTKELKENKEE